MAGLTLGAATTSAVVISLLFPVAFAEVPTVLYIDPLPSSVNAGDAVTFSGYLATADGYVIQGADIHIKDDVSFGLDDAFGVVVTDADGEFYVTWVAQTRDDGGAYDFYAVFEGSGGLDRSRSATYSVAVLGYDGTPSVGDAMEDDAIGNVYETPSGGGCLIATAAYGSELAPQVQILREIRDNILLSTDSGISFMTGFNQLYYSFSPAVADFERESVAFRDSVRVAITPALYTLSIMTLADQNSDASVIAFGLLTIAAMAGLYMVGPILAVRAIGKRVRHA